MARLPRLVLPGIPYHVTQRGNRRAQTFFEEADYALNPVRARLVERVEDWAWSSTRAHLGLAEDPLVKTAPLLERYGDFARFLGQAGDDEAEWRALRMSETSGRPLGAAEWLDDLEARTCRVLKPQKRGPKGRGKAGI